jgi:hypothetical protein
MGWEDQERDEVGRFGGLSESQERVLGKWLGFPKESTEQLLGRKHKFGISK